MTDIDVFKEKCRSNASQSKLDLEATVVLERQGELYIKKLHQSDVKKTIPDVNLEGIDVLKEKCKYKSSESKLDLEATVVLERQGEFYLKKLHESDVNKTIPDINLDGIGVLKEKSKSNSSESKLDLEATVVLERQGEFCLKKLHESDMDKTIADINSTEKTLLTYKNKHWFKKSKYSVKKKNIISGTIPGSDQDEKELKLDNKSENADFHGGNRQKSVNKLNEKNDIADSESSSIASDNSLLGINSNASHSHLSSDELCGKIASNIDMSVPLFRPQGTECSFGSNSDIIIEGQNKRSKDIIFQNLNPTASNCKNDFKNETDEGKIASTCHSNELVHSPKEKSLKKLKKKKSLLQSVIISNHEKSIERCAHKEDIVIENNIKSITAPEIFYKKLPHNCSSNSHNTVGVFSHSSKDPQSNIRSTPESMVPPLEKLAIPEGSFDGKKKKINKVKKPKCSNKNENSLERLNLSETNTSSDSTPIIDINNQEQNSIIPSIEAKTEENLVEGQSHRSPQCNKIKMLELAIDKSKDGNAVDNNISFCEEKDPTTVQNDDFMPLCELNPGDKYPMLSTDADTCMNRRCLVSLKRLPEVSSVNECNIHAENNREAETKEILKGDTCLVKALPESPLIAEQNITAGDEVQLYDKNANTLAINDPVISETVTNTQFETKSADAEPSRDTDESIEKTAFDMAVENLMADLGDLPGAKCINDISEITSNVEASQSLLDFVESTTTKKKSENLTVDSGDLSEARCTNATSDKVSNVEASKSLLDKIESTTTTSRPLLDSVESTTATSKPLLDIVETTTTSNPLLDFVDSTTTKRRSMAKPSGEGELCDKCCGHWFPSNKAYLNHLMSDSTEEVTKLHKSLLDELDMTKCSECSKWLKHSALHSHLRKIHKIKISLIAQENKIKNAATETRPVIKSVCSLKRDTNDCTPCPLSRKKASHTSIICHLTANKSMAVSSVSDLPFSLKPIVVIEKSLSRCKRKVSFHSGPRIVKVESLSSTRSDINSFIDTSVDKLMYRKSVHLKSLRSCRPLKHETKPIQKDKKLLLETVKEPVCTNKTNGKLKTKSSKFCYAESLKRNSLPLTEKNQFHTPTLKGKFCVGKAGTKMKVSKRFQLSNGYCLQDSSGDQLSDTSSSEEEISEQNNKENNDGVPTVELDLFTLPTVDEDSSVFLTDPSNPDFKVYANMDAIFVGDAGQVEPTSQLGYVTDTNNVVYINPEHFLFPNIDDSNISLDSVKLSPEDLELLSNFDSKSHASPSKSCILRKTSTPPKESNFSKRGTKSSPKLNRMHDLISPSKLRKFISDKNDVSPAKMSAVQNNRFSVKVNSKENQINMKQQNRIQSKVKIDPIKKALGLLAKCKNKDRFGAEVSACAKSSVQIDKYPKSKLDAASKSLLQEFFIDSENISIIDPELSNDMPEVDDSACSMPNADFDKELETSTLRYDNSSGNLEPIVIKVGKKMPPSLYGNSDKKYVITVHDSINKSLLKQYPNYWGNRRPIKYVSPHLKGQFNLKPKSDSYQSQFSHFIMENKNMVVEPNFKQVGSIQDKGRNNRSKRQYRNDNKSVVNHSPILSTDTENGSLLDTINIDPNSDIIDLPIDIGNETIMYPQTTELEACHSNVLSAAKLTPTKGNKSLSLEEEMKAKVDEFVYLDEHGVLRSPSGRDINKDKSELDEEALLINMIENYAETLEVPSTPIRSPKNVNFSVLVEDDVQKEKYLDILKGKSAWDTQLLFSPARNKVKRASSTDTAPDQCNNESYDGNRSKKRKQSDVDLYNIPLADIPDLLSPARTIGPGQNKFVINSPVALSPNTLSAVLNPSSEKIAKHRSPKRTPDAASAKESTYLSKRTTKNNSPSKKGRPPKNLFKTPIKIKEKLRLHDKSVLSKKKKSKSPKIKQKLGLNEKVVLPKKKKSKIQQKSRPECEPAKLPEIRKRRKSHKSVKTVVKVLKSFINYDNDDADFSGFEDPSEFSGIAHNLHYIINSSKSPSKARRKSLKLKISLKDRKKPIVMSPININREITAVSYSSPVNSNKRRRDDSPIYAHCKPKLYEDESVQGLVLKNFAEIANNYTASDDSKPNITSHLQDHTLPSLNHVEPNSLNKHHKQLNVRPIEELMEAEFLSPDVRNSILRPLDKSRDITPKNMGNMSSISESVTGNRVPFTKKITHRKCEEKKSRDIRSYFPPTNSTNSDVNNSFKGFHTNVRVRKEHKLKLAKLRNSSDIRNYLTVGSVTLQSPQDRVAYLEKRYTHLANLSEENDLLNLPRNFEGFSSPFSEGSAKLRVLQTFVDVLNMQNMFCTNDYSLPLDVTCDWDEETINHELDLM